MATSEHLQDVTAYVNEQASTVKLQEAIEAQEQKETDAEKKDTDAETSAEKLETPEVESVSPVAFREESPKTMYTSAFEKESMWGNNPWGSDRLEMRRQKRRSQETANRKKGSPKSASPLSAQGGRQLEVRVSACLSEMPVNALAAFQMNEIALARKSPKFPPFSMRVWLSSMNCSCRWHPEV